LADTKTLTGSRAHGAEFFTAFDYLCRVIPEIDIWLAANLMLKRYGEKAPHESAARADELAAQDDHNGAAVWRRITDAGGQLQNGTPPEPGHRPHNLVPQPYRSRSVNTLPWKIVLHN
jgi:hypothetical protein